MTNIERVLIGGIVVCFLLFAVSCTVFLNAVDDCQGLKGVTEAIWEGNGCEDE